MESGSADSCLANCTSLLIASFKKLKLLNFYYKFALSLSNATVSVAYNRYCNFLLITSLMKQGPDDSFDFTWIDDLVNPRIDDLANPRIAL